MRDNSEQSACCTTTSNSCSSTDLSCCSSTTTACDSSTTSSCCSSGPSECSVSSQASMSKKKWILGTVDTPAGPVFRISTRTSLMDKLGAMKVRSGINRMNYTIAPGLYAVGTPDENSPVLVTANYKLTFDIVRKELDGLHLWLMILDTKGVNVWCAAGKGTFGTAELIHRIEVTGLSQIVRHRTLILPQLGASGIAAHEITKSTSFHVVYGPVRAQDIKAFLKAGMNATKEMRTVRFTTYDRLVLTPNEIKNAINPALILLGIFFLLNLTGIGDFGVVDTYAYLGAFLSGLLITPLLLPLIPGRAFALKGWLVGLMWALLVNIFNGFPAIPDYGLFKTISYFLILPAISAFFAMTFTGSSTYTSLSGVRKEMKYAVPVMMLSAGTGVIILVISFFIHY